MNNQTKFTPIPGFVSEVELPESVQQLQNVAKQTTEWTKAAKEMSQDIETPEQTDISELGWSGKCESTNLEFNKFGFAVASKEFWDWYNWKKCNGGRYVYQFIPQKVAPQRIGKTGQKPIWIVFATHTALSFFRHPPVEYKDCYLQFRNNLYSKGDTQHEIYS